MIHDLDDPINKDLIKFVIIHQSTVRFPIYTPSDDSLMIRQSLSHGIFAIIRKDQGSYSLNLNLNLV